MIQFQCFSAYSKHSYLYLSSKSTKQFKFYILNWNRIRSVVYLEPRVLFLFYIHGWKDSTDCACACISTVANNHERERRGVLAVVLALTFSYFSPIPLRREGCYSHACIACQVAGKSSSHLPKSKFHLGPTSNILKLLLHRPSNILEL